MSQGWFDKWVERGNEAHREDEEYWHRVNPGLRRGDGWYVVPLGLGLVSLSFSLGWAWRGIAGIAICVCFLGFPAAFLGGAWWARASGESVDGTLRLTVLRSVALGVPVAAVVVFYQLFARH